MTSQERLHASLDHRAPDRVPIDFGGTMVTGIHVSCVAALRDHYGLERRPVRIHDPGQMLGIIDDDLRTILGLDVVGVFARKTRYGFPNENWREVRLPWGQVALASGHFRPSVDPNGD